MDYTGLEAMQRGAAAAPTAQDGPTLHVARLSERSGGGGGVVICLSVQS